MTTNKLLSTFSLKIGQLLEDDEFNTIIRVGGGKESSSSEVKCFKAHSIILKVVSPYFKNALNNNNMCMKDGNWIYLEKPNISPSVFEVILK